MSEDQNKMFQEVVGAVRAGQRERAKDLLTRLLRADKNNATYWVWMSSVVDSPKERVYCLQTALKLDPDHAAAKRGLILAGELSPDDVVPVPPPKRKWNTALETTEGQAPKKGLAALWYKLPPFFRARPVVLGCLGIFALLVLGIGGCLAGAVLWKPSDEAPFAYNTVPAAVTPRWETKTPTVTITPSPTPAVRTNTPTPAGATPLSALLEITYTPTARYIYTPHPISEAYQSGLRAYDQGNYGNMLLRMQQASTEMPNEADILYYQAEALRLLERYEEALPVYELAIEQNPGFAPVYLGRALISPYVDRTDEQIAEDLDQAILLDPDYVDAYLARAAYRLSIDDTEGALEDLDVIMELNPDHPRLYLLRAEAYLQTGENELALEDAQKAYEMDLTLLPAYLTLAKAYLANGQPEKAQPFAQTYLLYEKDDVDGWVVLGITRYQIGEDYDAALDAFERALLLNPDLVDVYYYRGLAYLSMDDAKSAVNDLAKASRLDSRSFDVAIALGQALIAADRGADAVRQFKAAEAIAEGDAELAIVYYWRAQANTAVNSIAAAIKDWEALLALPEDAVPEDWLEEAQEYLLALTPTPVPTETPNG